MAALEAQADRDLVQIREASGSGRLARAADLLLRLEDGFPGTSAASTVPELRETLKANPNWKKSVKAWRILGKAAREAKKGRDASFILPHLEEAKTQSPTTGVLEAVEALRRALFGPDGPEGFLRTWEALPWKGVS